jgi:hypothetical protein
VLVHKISGDTEAFGQALHVAVDRYRGRRQEIDQIVDAVI